MADEAEYDSHLSDAYFQINDASSAIEAAEALGIARRYLHPEFNLLVAIVQDGMTDLKASQNDARGKQRRAEAFAWFQSDFEDYVFSFRNICYALNVSATAARKRILGGEVVTREYHKSDSYWNRRKRGKHRQ